MKKKFNSGWMEEKDSLLIFSFFLRIDFLSSQNFLSVRSLYKSCKRISKGKKGKKKKKDQICPTTTSPFDSFNSFWYGGWKS